MIQCTKNANTLYTIYILDVVMLSKIVKYPAFYRRIIGNEIEEFPKESHAAINYIDYSYSVIGSNSTENLQNYLDSFNVIAQPQAK